MVFLGDVTLGSMLNETLCCCSFGCQRTTVKSPVGSCSIFVFGFGICTTFFDLSLPSCLMFKEPAEIFGFSFGWGEGSEGVSLMCCQSCSQESMWPCESTTLSRSLNIPSLAT